MSCALPIMVPRPDRRHHSARHPKMRPSRNIEGPTCVLSEPGRACSLLSDRSLQMRRSRQRYGPRTFLALRGGPVMGRLPPVSQDSRMAAFDFSAAQAVASMAEEQQASVPIQSLLMQINADAVCLVRTQF